MENWQPIETAPKDGTQFIAKIGKAIYGAYYSDGRFCWIMHANKATGRCYQNITIDGIEYQKELQPQGVENYQPEAKIWMLGFEDKPTHWMPLPKLPTNKE
jgi:hypothetical protein